jgi:hypothetical protein
MRHYATQKGKPMTSLCLSSALSKVAFLLAMEQQATPRTLVLLDGNHH